MNSRQLRRQVGRGVAMVRVARARLAYARRQNARLLRDTARWLATSSEYTNFTYDLQPLSADHLAWFVAGATGRPVAEIRGYLSEIAQDQQLRSVLRNAIKDNGRRIGLDESVRYGRRVGWYAIVRATRPRLVVETGVEKGLGTMVLAAAVARNAQEGNPGRVVGIDIDPTAGLLIRAPYAEYIDVQTEDSLVALQGICDIDVFIHDSNHTAEHEASELALASTRLAPGAVVLSDNAHVTSVLANFAESTGRRFLFFDERPANHPSPGGGIGVAFPDASNGR